MNFADALYKIGVLAFTTGIFGMTGNSFTLLFALLIFIRR